MEGEESNRGDAWGSGDACSEVSGVRLCKGAGDCDGIGGDAN